MTEFLPLAAGPLLANALASWVWLWPGVVSSDPLFGVLPTILVAFIEYPFVARAGVVRTPLLKSIRANLITLIAGIPIASGIWAVRSEASLTILACVAIVYTTAIELSYFLIVAKRESVKLRWQWIVFGNVLSNLALVGLSLAVRTLQVRWPELATGLMPYTPLFIFAHISISTTMVVASLAEPIISQRRRWSLASSCNGPTREEAEPGVGADSR